jgi:hypothetical protein
MVLDALVLFRGGATEKDLMPKSGSSEASGRGRCSGCGRLNRLNPARGVRTHLGSFNAGDAGSWAVVTLTNRAFDDARRSPQIGDGEKLNGERGERHIEREALVLKVWQETVPNWERTRCCDSGSPSFSFRRVKSSSSVDD